MAARLFGRSIEASGKFGAVSKRSVVDHNFQKTADTPVLKRLKPGESLPECKRIVVLVPIQQGIHSATFARYIWELASSSRTPVLYLCAASDYEWYMIASRELAVLAAITRDRMVKVDCGIVMTSDWIKACKSVLQPGDVVLGHAEQKPGPGLHSSEPFGDRLARASKTPIYLLSGYCAEKEAANGMSRRIIITTLLVTGLIAGFYELNRQVIRLSSGNTTLFALLLIAFAGYGTIWLWKSWTG